MTQAEALKILKDCYPIERCAKDIAFELKINLVSAQRILRESERYGFVTSRTEKVSKHYTGHHRKFYKYKPEGESVVITKLGERIK